MEFEDRVMARVSELQSGSRQQRDAREEFARMFVSGRDKAATAMQKDLDRAAHILSCLSVPTDLAVVTAGPDGSGWHYRAVGEGWHLAGDTDVVAFLTMDARICIRPTSRALHGRYLSPTTAEARIEKRNADGTPGTIPKRLENPDGLVPGTGELIDLGQEVGGRPVWEEMPQVLIGFGSSDPDKSRATALWPQGESVRHPGIRFDRHGTVWLTHSDGYSDQATELNLWLGDRVAALIADD